MPLLTTGRLLKADSLPHRATPVSLVYTDIETRCDELLNLAREQVDQLILQAESQAEQIRHDAQRMGHATGSLQAEAEFETAVEAEVQHRVNERLQSLLPPLQSALEQLAEDREQLLLQWESAFIRLSLTLAERLLRRELAINPLPPRELIAETLQLAAGANSVTLKLNPADVEDITAHSDDWKQLLATPGGLKVVADRRVSRGGCLVETDAGEIDGRLETQLERITEELLGTTNSE